MTDNLLLGVGVPQSGAWATPQAQLAVARRAEELGYHSLWTFSRLLVPVADGPAGSGGQGRSGSGGFYNGSAEPLISLAHLAGATRRIRLGLSVVNAPFFAPAVLAKQLIQLDQVSGGRLDAGLAQGWSEAEYLATGVPPERRLGRALEYIEVIRLMWEQEIAEFKGEFTELPRTLVRPRPVQAAFPLLLGGSVDRAFERAGRLAQGWLSPGTVSVELVERAARAVRVAAERAGKDPAGVRIVIRAKIFIGAARGPGRGLLHGDPAQIAADLRRLREAGASEAFLDFNFDPAIVGEQADPALPLATVLQALTALAPTGGS
ncbi:TIGR03619 family F420-dependent LLM class oxidoreductase [Kitasatospora sp. NBC_01287]|uniref:TIGR03619 family F420-dependent LLM class oxidoreductase n=1 Tax=Kitasatospora sp. NBC_01287 TaxID=2903573 RepID=UPI002254376D|nr:TIGR03619 family F420-dependent LLM class oxidoreductase [Kitasatospora sp. NBC_01287]MCX4745384.1 TIGR03619 family F420-dependent LLM class oxidoreductase [Kitasatospora sp. NBC_01287]